MCERVKAQNCWETLGDLPTPGNKMYAVILRPCMFGTGERYIDQGKIQGLLAWRGLAVSESGLLTSGGWMMDCTNTNR